MPRCKRNGEAQTRAFEGLWLFNPSLLWRGLSMPLCGAKVQILQMYSQDIISQGPFSLTGTVLADRPGTAPVLDGQTSPGKRERCKGFRVTVPVVTAIIVANAQAEGTAIFAGVSATLHVSASPKAASSAAPVRIPLRNRAISMFSLGAWLASSAFA